MKLISVMTMGLIVLAGCQTESWRGAGDRWESEQWHKAQEFPSLIARSRASVYAVSEDIQRLYPHATRPVGKDFGYDLSTWGANSWDPSNLIFILVRPFDTGCEIRIWSDDTSPGFRQNMAGQTWLRLRDTLDDRPAQSWLVYPPDPAGQYASKKFGAPKPGSPELSLN